jgi:hypothetical protein
MQHARKDEIFLPSAPAQGGIFYLNLIAVALGLAFCHPAQFMALNFSHTRAHAARVVCVLFEPINRAFFLA